MLDKAYSGLKNSKKAIGTRFCRFIDVAFPTEKGPCPSSQCPWIRLLKAETIDWKGVNMWKMRVGNGQRVRMRDSVNLQHALRCQCLQITRCSYIYIFFACNYCELWLSLLSMISYGYILYLFVKQWKWHSFISILQNDGHFRYIIQ